MSEAVVYEQFDETGQPIGAEQPDSDLRRLSDVPMELSVEIGRTRMTVGENLLVRSGVLASGAFAAGAMASGSFTTSSARAR